jgi:hypothetical protein
MGVGRGFLCPKPCSYSGLWAVDTVCFVSYAPIMRGDNSVGIATDYGLDDRMIEVRFRAGAGNFSLRHIVQTGSGTHPASYPMGTSGSFPGSKAAEM